MSLAPAVPAYVRALLVLTAIYGALAFVPLSGETVPLSVIAVSMPLAAALIALSVIDLHTMRLPDAITLPLLAAGPLVAYVLGWDGVPGRIGAAAAGFMFLFSIAYSYRALRGRAGLGLGDAKLLAAAGAWLGFDGLPSVMVWATGAALLGVLAAIVLRQPVEATTRIPFGPFLAFGFWMVWLYGPIA
jgi:leader peptidase (prepilin peptidase)/N-methyltransferase